MNQASQGYHYFSLQTEPRIDFTEFHRYQRKPSCDDLLGDLTDKTKENMTEDHDFAKVDLVRVNKKESNKGVKKVNRKSECTKNLNNGKASGHWRLEEHKRYHWFLEIHFNHFLNKHLRRMEQIFKSMEKFVGTRQAEQCRSHHQKTQKKYGTFINILRELRRQSYGNEGVASLIEDMHRNGIEYPSELLNLEVTQVETPQSEVQESSRQTLDQINQNEVFLDPFHELNQEYQPNISFLMF